jgi:hypothetical protein
MKKSNFWLGLSAVGLSLSVLAAAGSTLAFGPYENLINDALGLNVKKISKSFRSDYADENGNLSDDGWKRMIKDAYQFAVEEEEQGSVLLKNDKNVLPLQENEHKVTVFGYNAAHLFHRSGAGGAAPNDAYATVPVPGFDAAKVLSDLGAGSWSDVSWVCTNAEGGYEQEYNADPAPGFWYDKLGFKGAWGDNASVFVLFNADEQAILVGQMPGQMTAGSSVDVEFDAMYGDKIEKIVIHVVISAYQDPETAPEG